MSCSTGQRVQLNIVRRAFSPSPGQENVSFWPLIRSVRLGFVSLFWALKERLGELLS